MPLICVRREERELTKAEQHGGGMKSDLWRQLAGRRETQHTHPEISENANLSLFI